MTAAACFQPKPEQNHAGKKESQLSETQPETPAGDALEPGEPQDIACHGTTALPALGGDD